MKPSAFSIPVVALLVLGALVLSAAAQDGAPVNINTAGVEELSSLKGVGPKYAEAIVRFRETNGGFAAAEDLINVPGIGPKTLEVNKDRITVD
jgi:competence protein ComEA